MPHGVPSGTPFFLASPPNSIDWEKFCEFDDLADDTSYIESAGYELRAGGD
jgi:hypothetical protein